MARKVFFSFHFERDYWRAGQVRSHWLTKPNRESAGYWDAAGWEKVKKEGPGAIKRWINNHLEGASVTVVLIGSETSNREWVNYEITESHRNKMGLFGIYIHNLKDRDGYFDPKGPNPFENWVFRDATGNEVTYPLYDWVNDNGYSNFGDWVEEAARKAGR